MATLPQLDIHTGARPIGAGVARRRSWRRRATPWLYIGPAVLLHVFVIGGPAVFTFFLSLTSWNGFTFGKFIGLANYHQILGDGTAGAAMLNNIRWTILFLTIPVALGLGSAMLISRLRSSGLQMTYRAIFYLPATVSSAVVGRLWQWIYDPFYGINNLLSAWGWNNLALGWLSDPAVALYSVAAADNW